MAGRASTDTADRAWEMVSRTAWGRFRAVDRASRGTSTRLMALKKTVGRASMGRVMPHTTPSSEMAWEGSMPPSTSFWGTRAAFTAPMRLPSRALSPTGRAMENTRLRRTLPGSPGPFRPMRRSLQRHSTVRVTAEATSQMTMPATIRPTTRSGYWGRK